MSMFSQLLHAYLVGYVYWLMIPLGCTAILMMHHLTGGWWGYPIRRLLEAGSRTFGVMAILFLPILLGMKLIYPWVTSYGEMAGDPNFRFKLAYLTPQFFVVRVVIYFLILFTLSYFLNKWSREQDRTGDPATAKKLEAFSGPGLILWGIVVSFSMIDWVMSLEPQWFSTIYGMIFMIVGALTAMSFIVFVVRRMSDDPAFKDVTAGQYNDLGNLMLAFTMLWAYLSFSQFLIIWSGNIKDEIPWYMTRAFGGWAVVAVILIVLHFALPFLAALAAQHQAARGAAGESGGLDADSQHGGRVLAHRSRLRKRSPAFRFAAARYFVHRRHRNYLGEHVFPRSEENAVAAAARPAL